MLEKSTRLISESLARNMDRRNFLKRAGETVFAGMAALAAGQLVPSLALASSSSPSPIPTAVPSCAPPGPYCNLNGVNDPNGCHGSSCFQHLFQGKILQCRVFYIYQAGCWTTAAQGGYWTCCDCACGTPQITNCGCAQFSLSPTPRPDGIEAGAKS